MLDNLRAEPTRPGARTARQTGTRPREGNCMLNIIVSPAGLMDIPNAAKYLGCPESSIRWMRRMRKLPFARIGAKLMVRQSDLDKYVESSMMEV